MEKSWHLFERNKELVLPDQIPRTTRTREERADRLGQVCSNRYFIRADTTKANGNRLDLHSGFSRPRKTIEIFSNYFAFPILLSQFCFPNFAFPMHPIESLQ